MVFPTTQQQYALKDARYLIYLRRFPSPFFKNTPSPPPSIPVALPLASAQISGSTVELEWEGNRTGESSKRL
jgi:hypothetical protein